MPTISGGSGGGGGGMAVLFDSTASGSVASIDTGANGIVQTYSALEIILLARTDEAVNFSNLVLRINGDAGANYDTNQDQNVNNVLSGGVLLAQTSFQVVGAGASTAASVFASCTIIIPGYAQTTAKKAGVMMMGVSDPTAANNYVRTQALTWRSTAGINQLTVAAPAGKNLVAGSRLTVYGKP